MDYKIEIVNIDKLKLNLNNTRQHTDLDIKNLIKSIHRFGFKNPIIAKLDGTVLVGNGRLEACKQMGITEVPVHYTDMSEEDAKAFAIMDNRSAELSTWNLEYLLPQLDALKLNDLLEFTGFNNQSFIDLMLNYNKGNIENNMEKIQLDLNDAVTNTFWCVIRLDVNTDSDKISKLLTNLDSLGIIYERSDR